ncbi:MAG: ABC-type transport auxiliary lipoprotein family protein [Deltaproteobacteria bacterium]
MTLTRRSLIFLVLLSCCACSSLKQPGQKIDYYTLEYDPPRVEGLRVLPFVLRIERFSVSPLYNTHQIIYRDRAFKREAYPYEKWRAGPGDLVTYYLSRDFKHAGLFKTVAPFDSRVEPSLVMEGSVDEFFEWDSEEGWKAVLTVSTVLLRHPEPDLSKRIVFQKTFHADKPCRKRNVTALSEAMSEAMADVSAQVIRTTFQHLTR